MFIWHLLWYAPCDILKPTPGRFTVHCFESSLLLWLKSRNIITNDYHCFIPATVRRLLFRPTYAYYMIYVACYYQTSPNGVNVDSVYNTRRVYLIYSRYNIILLLCSWHFSRCANLQCVSRVWRYVVFKKYDILFSFLHWTRRVWGVQRYFYYTVVKYSEIVSVPRPWSFRIFTGSSVTMFV